MGFLNPLGLLALLGIPVIVVMYLLKQKHKEYKVPSIMLWKRSVNINLSQSPFQKLRRSLLLILQILTVILIAIILSRPYINRQKIGLDNIFVFDISMSMQSEVDGVTNIDIAKKYAIDIVEKSKSDSRFSIIEFGNNSKVIMSYENNKNDVVRYINNLQAGYDSNNIEALNSCIEAEASKSQANIYIFTDKNIEDENYTVFNVGQAGENVGISFISHSLTEDITDVLVKVKNYGDQKVKRTISLYTDDEIFDAKEIEIEGNGYADVYFNNVGDKHFLKAVLSHDDVLEADDTYYYVMGDERIRKILIVGEGNFYIEKVLNVFENFEVYKTNDYNLENVKGYDLYIFDGYFPEDYKLDGHVIMINPPENNSFIKTGDEFEAGDIKVNDDDLFKFIDEFDFYVSHAKNIECPSWGNAVAYYKDKPVIISGEKEGIKSVIFAFDLFNSDLPLKKEFPILVNNILGYLFQQGEGFNNVKVGERIDFSVHPSSVGVNLYNNEGKHEVLAPPFPLGTYEGFKTPGIYKLVQVSEDKSENVSYYAANINSDESSFKDDKLNIESNNIIKAENSNYKKNISLFIGLVLLLILAIEWWVSVND